MHGNSVGSFKSLIAEEMVDAVSSEVLDCIGSIWHIAWTNQWGFDGAIPKE